MAKLQINKKHHRNFRVAGKKLVGKFGISNKELREAVKNGHWFINPPRSETRTMMWNRKQFNDIYYRSARQKKLDNVASESQYAEEHAFGW